MKKLIFTRNPLSCDVYGQPCFLVNQRKGLYEAQNNQLLQGALLDGYTVRVGQHLKDWVRQQVVGASAGQKIDVLKIGGGTGAFFDSLKGLVGSYINVEPGQVDLSEKDLERLTHADYATIKCSAEDIPLPDGSVDVVVSIASLDHIPDYQKALREVARLLRIDGVFILTLNNRRSWWKVLLSDTKLLKAREAEIDKEHYFQWSFAECEANLCKHLEITRASTLTFFPFIPKIWRFVLPSADVLGKVFLHRRGANILMVCQKRSQPRALR
jgi:ubiquinone/menaquinone biosynthesis C-methylase UbiE